MNMENRNTKPKFLSVLMFFILFLFSSKTVFAIDTSYDVVIAGAGTGGIGAAIQAARMGAKVLLIEETDYLGGQMSTAAVGAVDVGNYNWNTGIYKEFQDKIVQYYTSRGLPYNLCWTGYCFEPHVVNQILGQMIANEPNINLQKMASITSVQKSGNKIIGVTLNNGSVVQTKTLVDATEYGDVLRIAGSNYRIGNGTNLNSPSDKSCIQDITYVAMIKKYPNGLPNNLRIKSQPPGYNSEVQKIFSDVVTNNGSNSRSGAINYPVSWEFHNTYRAVTNSVDMSYDNITKTGVNWANDFPASHPYINYTNTLTLSYKYLEDTNYRRVINCQAKLRTIQFLYYMQNVLGKSDWSVTNDEGYDGSYNSSNLCSSLEKSSPGYIPPEFNDIEKNMPQIPYVRESVRGIGPYTLTAKDIKRVGNPLRGATVFNDSIAIGSYGNDLHNCNTDEYLETDFETEADKSIGWPPFQIPEKTLYSANVDGLIFAEKNISQTRLSNGATRLQPTTMIIGQASGALAAISAIKNVNPSVVNPIEVQKAVIAHKSMLFPFTDLTLDNKYFYDIQMLAVRNIMRGYGNLVFGVKDNLTRGASSAVISRAFSISPVFPTKQTFVDVPLTHTFASTIEAMYKLGITTGCSTNPLMFCPDSNVTNAQIAAFMYRALLKANIQLNSAPSTTSTYSDVPKNHYAYGLIEGLAVNGITWYCDESTKKFCPDSPINRESTANAINKLMEKCDKLGGCRLKQYLKSDLNYDGKVDSEDLNVFVREFVNQSEVVDLNNDGKIDILDYNVLVGEYGKTS